MVNSIIKRAKYVATGEDGASMLEVMGYFAVCLIVIAALIGVGNVVKSFLENAKGTVDGINQEYNIEAGKRPTLGG